ncbi:unnamed protein product [Auanema sp. JU1783]|nr:unnamed protein product [Auanema sp. JU1783]
MVMADHEDDIKVLTSLSELANVSENLTRTLGTENVLSEIQSTISLPEVETLSVVNGGLPADADSINSQLLTDVRSEDVDKVATDEFVTTETTLVETTTPSAPDSFVDESFSEKVSTDSQVQGEATVEANDIAGTQSAGSVTSAVEDVEVTEEPTTTTTEEPTTTTTEGPTTTTLPYIAPSTTEEALLNAGSYSDIYFDINSVRAKVVAWKAFQEDINGRLNGGNWWIPLKVLAGSAQVVNGVQYEMRVVGGQSNCTQEMNIWDMMPERCSYAEGGRRAIFNIITYEKNSRWTDYSPILSRSYSILIREVYPGEDMEQLS